jgi:hypothetical protein
MIFLSPHRCTVFQVGDLGVYRVTYCNPKGTNSESYQEDLQANLSRAIHLMQDVQLAVDMLQQAVLPSYHQNYPASRQGQVGLWWNNQLRHFSTLHNCFLINPKEQATGNHIRQSSPIRRSERPNGPLERTTVKGLGTYLIGPN